MSYIWFYVNNLGYPYALIFNIFYLHGIYLVEIHPKVSLCVIRFDEYRRRNSDSENY